VMPEYNAWKIFYERNKQAAYLTDSTKGTTPIYQEIKNLSAAKSAYGNIVYRKAPSFLRQTEFYIGEDKFQTAVHAFLKKHEFANAEWRDLVKEFEVFTGEYARFLSASWVLQRGMPKFTYGFRGAGKYAGSSNAAFLEQSNPFGEPISWWTEFNVLTLTRNALSGEYERRIVRVGTIPYRATHGLVFWDDSDGKKGIKNPDVIFPNYQDYGYGIFLLDDKSRDYVLKNIQDEKDDFLRTMMWGSLWDSVREAELDPKEYVELVIKNIIVETDESTIQTLLGRVSTAMTYYLRDEQRDEIAPRLEAVLIDKMLKAPTPGQRITFYRSFLNVASTPNARRVLKEMLYLSLGLNSDGGKQRDVKPPLAGAYRNYKGNSFGCPTLKTKDKFDIVTRLLILGDPDAATLIAQLEKSETSDEAKRYAYAAKAGVATAQNKSKYWNDFTTNKDISESWIESSLGAFNSPRHADLTLPYLERALAELPKLKRDRKIFFVNGWLAAFIGGQKSEQALAIVNKFLADNPNLDNDLRLKILENLDVIERAVKIRSNYAK